MKDNYGVANCLGNTNLVVNLLSKLKSSLGPVVRDADSASPSDAYKAFFKDPSYAPFVSALFTNVTTSVPLTPPRKYSHSGGVTFLCVNAPEQFKYRLGGIKDAYTECVAKPNVASNYIGFVPPMQYVILCPSFFNSDIDPVPPPNRCLTVNTHINRFIGDGQSLWGYQMWMLLQMITHYYLFVTTGSVGITNTNDVNKCFLTEAKEAILEANNYLYYAASRSSSFNGRHDRYV